MKSAAIPLITEGAWDFFWPELDFGKGIRDEHNRTIGPP
jgi:hypothetical protein